MEEVILAEIMFFIRYMPRSGITGSCGNSVLTQAFILSEQVPAEGLGQKAATPKSSH